MIKRKNKPNQPTLFSIDEIIPKKDKKPLKPPKNANKGKSLPQKADLFLTLLNQRYSQTWEAEYKFHPVRKWRMDFACPELKICIEIDGGIFIGGRHSRPIGMLKDNEKLNTAASMGWLVLKFTPQQKTKTETFELIDKAVESRQ